MSVLKATNSYTKFKLKYNNETKQKLIDILSGDLPECFHIGDSFRVGYQNNYITYLEPTYIYSKAEYKLEYYKDFKARQSTKMIGESLELHCLNQFNSLRMTAFPNAYFEKDNDVATGSKGDFIFRESSEDGTEFISIMFEMKNEADETKTKHKILIFNDFSAI